MPLSEFHVLMVAVSYLVVFMWTWIHINMYQCILVYMKTWTHLLILCCQGHLNKPLSGKTKIIQVFSWCFIFHDTASPHTMKDATGVPPERPFIYVSGAWRKSPGYSAGRSITKRHTVSCKLSRWNASVTHLISLPIQHVHSSRRCSCSQLHTSLSLPCFNL